MDGMSIARHSKSQSYQDVTSASSRFTTAILFLARHVTCRYVRHAQGGATKAGPQATRHARCHIRQGA
eukprot:6203643-Pleurochrysis_carterae.AAC.2